MTTKRIVYRRSDGVVEIVNPDLGYMADLMTDNPDAGYEGVTEDEALAIIQTHAASKLPERGFGPMEDAEILEASQIPQTQPGDRAFRGALEKPGSGAPVVNIPKARITHMDRIRAARDKELGVIDTALALAEDQIPPDAAEAARLRVLRQTLRDIPQNFDLSGATTPEALDALWPSELPARP